MTFSTSAENDRITYMVYTQIMQDILDIDDRFHILAQEAKNCFAKYYDMVMRANNKHFIEQVREKENDKEGKLNYAQTFMQLLKKKL